MQVCRPGPTPLVNCVIKFIRKTKAPLQIGIGSGAKLC